METIGFSMQPDGGFQEAKTRMRSWPPAAMLSARYSCNDWVSRYQLFSRPGLVPAPEISKMWSGEEAEWGKGEVRQCGVKLPWQLPEPLNETLLVQLVTRASPVRHVQRGLPTLPAGPGGCVGFVETALGSSRSLSTNRRLHPDTALGLRLLGNSVSRT